MDPCERAEYKKRFPGSAAINAAGQASITGCDKQTEPQKHPEITDPSADEHAQYAFPPGAAADHTHRSASRRSGAYSATFDVISKHSGEGQAAIGVLFVDGRYPGMFTEKQSARPYRETEEATRKSRAEDDFSAAVSSG